MHEMVKETLNNIVEHINVRVINKTLRFVGKRLWLTSRNRIIFRLFLDITKQSIIKYVVGVWLMKVIEICLYK